jgi:hypothetical protein
VFRPLAAYRESWNPEEGVAASGVFRSLSEDGPSKTTHDLTSTKIYIRPSEELDRIKHVVTKQSEDLKPATSNEIPEKRQISDLMTDNTGGKNRSECRDNGTELYKRSDIKKLDSSEAKRGESEPSGDSAQHTFPPSGSVSETLAGNRSRCFKLESSLTLSSSAEHQGMHPAARDTGQQRGFGSSGVTLPSRASSPGTNSSSGSSCNFSSTTERTGDSRGLRATPMGSTTGLLPDNTSSCSQSKLKVSTDFAMSLTLSMLLRDILIKSKGGTYKLAVLGVWEDRSKKLVPRISQQFNLTIFYFQERYCMLPWKQGKRMDMVVTVPSNTPPAPY